MPQLKGDNNFSNKNIGIIELTNNYSNVVRNYLLKSFNDKTIFSRNSDQKNANCYQVDLAWLIIFKDIILIIDDMIVKMIQLEELTNKRSLGETITPEQVNTVVTDDVIEATDVYLNEDTEEELQLNI